MMEMYEIGGGTAWTLDRIHKYTDPKRYYMILAYIIGYYQRKSNNIY